MSGGRAGSTPALREWQARLLAFLAIVSVAGFLLGYRLDVVKAPIWDESYYVTAEARLREGHIQFASHPPLGIMLIAAGDAVGGFNRDADWRKIGARKSIRGEDMPPGFDWRGPRLAPSIFGALAAGLFFLLMAELSGSTGAGLTLSPLFLCDAAFITQFRAGQLDAFQVAFVLAALICAVKGLRSGQGWGWAAGFGACVMLAAMVRANGVLLAPLGLLIVWQRLRQCDWRGALVRSIAGGVAALSVVTAVFGIMLALSPLAPETATEAGRIDVAHVTRIYAGLAPIHAAAAYAGDYAEFMASDLSGMAKADANASGARQWLTGGGAITYRWDSSADEVATVALAPNRVAWLISLAGVLWAIALIRMSRRRDPASVLLLAGWLINMAALVWLDGQRVMYAYHYFIPLLLGHALAALGWRRAGCDERLAWPALACLTLYAALSLPLALHQPVAPGHCQLLLDECGGKPR